MKKKIFNISAIVVLLSLLAAIIVAIRTKDESIAFDEDEDKNGYDNDFVEGFQKHLDNDEDEDEIEIKD